MIRHNNNSTNNNNDENSSSDGGGTAAAAWIKRKKVEGMKRPYCMRVYPAGSPQMKVLEKLYYAHDKSLSVSDFCGMEKKCLDGLAARQLIVEVTSVGTLKGKEGKGEGRACNNNNKKIAITTPGVVHFIASRLGLSFAYAVYLAYLYTESRDPLYAFTLAGGDADLAKMMVEGKAEYPYGILYRQRADKKFEGTNMFVLGTYLKEKGCCLNGLMPQIARHELSRRGIVRCVPGGTLMISHEKYKELQEYDADLRAIVTWADKVCDRETAERMSEAAILVGVREFGRGGNQQQQQPPRGELRE